MKRVGSSDSLAPICTSDWLEDNDEDTFDASGHAKSREKKRRLGAEQVKALEKNFEVENKLEPERKARLAQELGLQPRQVAVWFQNRRARWKTKQLEHDYGVLKSRYEALQVEYEKMVRDKESLLDEVKDLKAKLNFADESVSNIIKDEPEESESNDKPGEEILIYKDGSSDSDSSAVLNDKENNARISFKANTNVTKNSSFSSPLVFKVEDDVLGGDEPCSSNFFHDEQPPTLSWYCGGGWE